MIVSAFPGIDLVDGSGRTGTVAQTAHHYYRGVRSVLYIQRIN